MPRGGCRARRPGASPGEPPCSQGISPGRHSRGIPPCLTAPRQPARACAPNPSLPNPELAPNETDRWELSSPSCSCSRRGIAAARKNTGLLLLTPRGPARPSPPAAAIVSAARLTRLGRCCSTGWGRSWVLGIFFFWPTRASSRNWGAEGGTSITELAGALAPGAPRYRAVPSAPASCPGWCQRG